MTFNQYKPRHYSYECKATAQERPYRARPSRTQQLANPKLVPKLSSDVSKDLLRKEGIADEQLAKIERERGRQRHSADLSSPHSKQSGGPRSLSMSSASVSTISSNARSRSASPRRMKLDDPFTSQRDSGCPSISPTRKRRRYSSTSSSGSNSSISSYGRHRPSRPADRNTRRRRSFLSPDARGRGARRRRSRSRSNSMDRSQIARHRNSISPDGERLGNRKTERDGKGDRGRAGELQTGEGKRNGVDGGDRHGRASRRNQVLREEGPDNSRRQVPPVERRRAPERQRSMSPFSKRLALTQAMSLGR